MKTTDLSVPQQESLRKPDQSQSGESATVFANEGFDRRWAEVEKIALRAYERHMAEQAERDASTTLENGGAK